MPFFIFSNKRSEAASSPAVTAMQPDAANNRHRSGEKASSKRMLPHHVMVTPRSRSRRAKDFKAAGGAASSTK